MSDADDRQDDREPDDRETDNGEPDVDVDHGTIPTDTRGEGGIGSVSGVAGVGSVGTDFGIAGNVPEPPGVDEELVTMEDESEDADAVADRDEPDDGITP
jgi:hypothetical protein